MNTRRAHIPFWLQVTQVLRTVRIEMCKRKFGTLLTILAISVSLTIPSVSYLLWKNLYLASHKFYPEAEIRVYLDKALDEKQEQLVVDEILIQDGVASVNYVSRQEGLDDFVNWSGFSEELDILDRNPLPALALVKPTEDYSSEQKNLYLREKLKNIKGVQDVQLDNDAWIKKLTLLSKFIGKIALSCIAVMLLAVLLVISNSVRADIYSNRASIEVMMLLGATNKFILRPYLCSGIIYGVLGGLLASAFSMALICYFASMAKVVVPLFDFNFELHGLSAAEVLFPSVACALVGYIGAWLSARRYIKKLEKA